ncbi:MAG: response regulator [Planctomycetes bacterium]|nr:response regulator [Planctomycetota bacterium]
MADKTLLLLTDRTSLEQEVRRLLAGQPGTVVRRVGTALSALEALRGSAIELVLVDAESVGLEAVHLGRMMKSPDVPWLNGIPVLLVVERQRSGLLGLCLTEAKFDGELRLPLAAEELAARLAGPRRPVSGPTAAQFRGRVLLVEDDDDTALTWSHVLAGAGFRPARAVTGEEAFEKIRSERPHVLVVDYRLPGGQDGLSVVRYGREVLPAVGIIVVTGFGSEELVVEMMRAGVDDYIRKPVDIQTLLAVCEGAMRRGMLRDLASRLFHLEKEILAAHEEVVRTERLAALGELALAVRHQMNNALTALQGNLELLVRCREELAPRAQKLAGAAHASCQRMIEAMKRLADIRDDRTIEYLDGQKMTDLSLSGDGSDLPPASPLFGSPAEAPPAAAPPQVPPLDTQRPTGAPPGAAPADPHP